MTVIYEKRTYAIKIGEMPEVKRLYGAEGWPALSAVDQDKHLIGYFISDTGDLHQLIHLWKFDSDENRRAFWAKLSADEKFAAFAKQLRSLIISQHVQLIVASPWGPHP